MRKNFLTVLIAATALMFASCETFTTSYERIEDTELRMLNFVYEPADAAPGDTITVHAYFGGKTPVVIDDYIKEWWVSFNVLNDMFGNVTVVDSSRLEPIRRDYKTGIAPPDNPNTQYVEFKVPLPADMMKTGAAIPQVWTDMLAPFQLANIPPAFADMSRDDIIDALANFTEGNAVDHVFLPVLLQYFTVTIQIKAVVDLGPGRLPHAIRSRQRIRYNSRVASVSSRRIPINKNPVVDEILIFRVNQKDLILFDESLEHDTIPLYFDEENVIEVLPNHSYFIKAVTDASKDSSMTQWGRWDLERHEQYWQYQLRDSELSGVKVEDYMNIHNQSFDALAFEPPKNHKIENFILWVTVTDDFANERLRPLGSVLREVRGRFEYR